MPNKHIALLPGDGIGSEVLDPALQILNALPNLDLTFGTNPCGAGEYLRSGDPLPLKTMEACITADAILLGAMGLPDVRWPDRREMAPDIAGKGIANPVAAILSAAMMLDWFDEPVYHQGAARIRSVVETVLSNPYNATPDLGGLLGTRELTNRIAEVL